MKLTRITPLAIGCVTAVAMAAAPATTFDDIAYIWRTNSGEGLTSVLNGRDVDEHRRDTGSHWGGLGDVRGITALESGDYAVAEYGGTLRLRSGDDGSHATSVGNLGNMVAVTQLPGGPIITVADDGMMRARDAGTLGNIDSWNRTEPWTDVVSQSATTFVATTPESDRITRFDYNTTSEEMEFGTTKNGLGGSGDPVLDVLSNGNIVWARDGQLRVRGSDPNVHVAGLSNQGDVRALAITSDDRIVVGNTNGNLRIHNADLSDVLDNRTFNGEQIQHVAVQSTGDIVVASLNASNEGILRVLDGNDLSTQLTGATIHSNGEWRGLAVLVPEPGSLGLLGIAAAGLLVRRRR